MSENITMEIINNEKFHRANIRFSGIPNAEIRNAMKKEGWTFSHTNKVWYPTSSAAQNSLNFAKKLKETYFPKQNITQNKEQTDKEKLKSIISGSTSLTEILNQLTETFGTDTIEKALTELKRSQDMENMALREKSTGKIFTIQKSDQYGYDWTLFDKDYIEIDGGNYFSSYSENFNRDDYQKTMLEFTKDVLHDYGINYDDCEDADFDETLSLSFDKLLQEADEARRELELEKKYENEENEISDMPEPEENFDSDYDDYESENEEPSQYTATKKAELSDKEIEKLLAEDISRIFSDLNPQPYIEKVKIYHPEEFGLGNDGNIHLLVQYETNSAEGFWHEDDLFNAIAENNITFNGKKVDVNPIAPSKSGTIEEYLSHLKDYYERDLKEQEELKIENIISKAVKETVENKFREYEPEYNENTNLLSWLDMEELFSTREIRETKNEVLKSFNETDKEPTEKELKEECFARLLENQIDFYGFDTNKNDNRLNSEISVAKWNILEKIAEKTVSKEIDLKPYAAIQEEANRLLKENPLFRECIENNIISAPEIITKTDILSDKIAEIKKEIQKEDAGYDFSFIPDKNRNAPTMRIYKDGNHIASIISYGNFTAIESNTLPDGKIHFLPPETSYKLEHIYRLNDEIIKEKHKELEGLKTEAKIQNLSDCKAILYENDKYASKICHLVKDNGDLKATQIIAEFLAEQINEDCVLVPVPQHTGKAEYTATISQKIAEIKGQSFSVEVADILKTTPHKPIYEQKKEITEGEKRLLTDENIKNLDTGKLYLNENYKNFEKALTEKKVFIIDNVIGTGSTIKAVQNFIPDSKPLVFAVSPNYMESISQTVKQTSASNDHTITQEYVEEKHADSDLLSNFENASLNIETKKDGKAKGFLTLANNEKIDFDFDFGEDNRELDGYWYGFTYRNQEFDMNIYKEEESEYSVTFYPVVDGKTDSTNNISSKNVKIENVYENTFENLSNKETIKYLKDYFNEKNVSISDDLAEEMFYKHLDNGLELKKTKDELYFYTVDEETGKTEYVSTHKIVDNVLSWNEKELSELHSGTSDDKDIESLKGFVSQLETIKTHFHRVFETFPPVDFKISDFTRISNANSENEKQISFIDDEEKMRDFANISKDEFLSSYYYLSEEEYDATEKDYNKLNQTAVQSHFSDTVKTVEDINKVYNNNLDFIEQNISFKYGNPEYNEIDEIEKWKNGELFIPVADRNGNFTSDMEVNTLEDYNLYANKNFKTYSEIIEHQAELKAKLFDSAIEHCITEYLIKNYAETKPGSGKFEYTVENQSYPLDEEELNFITATNEWGSVDDRLNEILDRRFEEEIEQKKNDIISDVVEYIAQETDGKIIPKEYKLEDILFSNEMIQIYAPKDEFLAIQPEETKQSLIKAGIEENNLYTKEFNFDWSNFTEKDFNTVKEHIKTNEPLQSVFPVWAGSICIELIKDSDGAYTNYYIGSEYDYANNENGLPYGYEDGINIDINLFSEDYESFKRKYETLLSENFSKNKFLSKEASRPTVNWDKQNDGIKLHNTKLTEKIFAIAQELHKNETEEKRTFIENNYPDYMTSEKIKRNETLSKVITGTASKASLVSAGMTEPETVYTLEYIHNTLEIYRTAVETFQKKPENTGKQTPEIFNEDNLDKISESISSISFPEIEKEYLNNLEELKIIEMQEERSNDFSYPNPATLDQASIPQLKEYCNLIYQIPLTDEQAQEIYEFYNNNEQYGLYATPKGNLYIHNDYTGNTVSADGEILLNGNRFRQMPQEEQSKYIQNYIDEDFFEEMTEQFAETKDGILKVLSNALADSFNTLDSNPDYWQNLLDKGTDPREAIKNAAVDANLGDNLNWLLDNVPAKKINEIFSDKSYADEVFDIAKESVSHDIDSWGKGTDIGFNAFNRIAVLCDRKQDADRHYGEILEQFFETPVEPKINLLLDTPELLAEKLNEQLISPGEPKITPKQAEAILYYCNHEDTKFYCDKDGNMHKLDVSYDYTGEGIKQSVFDIVATGMEYADKAKDFEHKIYDETIYNTIKDLWTKERDFYNPSQQIQKNSRNKKATAKKYFEISENLANSYLTDREKAILNDYEENQQSKNQVERSIRSTEFFVQYYDKNTGYFEKKNQKKITSVQARKLLSADDFISGLDRASFHWTSFRQIDAETGIMFDDSPKNGISIKPYILSEEDKEIISDYESTKPKIHITKENFAEFSLKEDKKTQLYEMIKNSGSTPLFIYSEENHRNEDSFIISNSGNGFDLQYYNLKLNILSEKESFATLKEAEENAILKTQKYSAFFNAPLPEYELSDVTQPEQKTDISEPSQKSTEEQIEALAEKLGLSPLDTPVDDISSTVTDGKITIHAEIEMSEDLQEETDRINLKIWENDGNRTIKETSFDISSESGHAHAHDIVDTITEAATELNIPLSELEETVVPKKIENTNQTERRIQKEIQLTPEDIEIARIMIPKAQYEYTIELTQGEEGEFFKQKIKDAAETYRQIRTDKEILNEDGTHPLGFRYFLGNTEIYISEIYSDGTGFGYTILNGDLQMSEWGYSSIEEITEIPQIQMDYHIPKGITIEEMLYENHPNYFEKPDRMKTAEKEISEAEILTKEDKPEISTPAENKDISVETEQPKNFEAQCIENFEKLITDLAYKDRENQPDFLSEKNNKTERTYIEICKEYLSKTATGENIFNANNENAINEALFFFRNLENLKNTLETDDNYSALAGFLEEREKPLSAFENEDDYYKQPIAADILNDKLNQIDKDLHSQISSYIIERGEYLFKNIISQYGGTEEEYKNIIDSIDLKTANGRYMINQIYENGIIAWELCEKNKFSNTPGMIDKTYIIERTYNTLSIEKSHDKESEKTENIEKHPVKETEIKTDLSPAPSVSDIKKIREQCREILEKIDNSYFNEEEKKYLNKLEKQEKDRKQVEESLRSMKYVYTTKRNNAGYWDVDAGKEITANQARKMLSMTAFVSAIDNVSLNFDYTSGRETKDGKGLIFFNDSDRFRKIYPYALTEEDLSILSQYEGAGGLNEKDRSASGILHEFYTPNNVIEKVWKIADTYAPNAKTVLEPSSGIGKFAKNRPNNDFTMHELDETSARIAKILHPDATVIQGAFQKQFFDENERAINKDYKLPTYDIVIGNPPYGKYNDKYKGLGEGKDFDTYEEYFLSRGLDSLKDENSLLVFVMPSGFLNSSNDRQKQIIASKGKLIDAYRLPEKTFPTTEVGTDIVVFKKGSCNAEDISYSTFFSLNPHKILGEKTVRKNRFGKQEEFVKLPEGMSIQNELDKIDGLVKESAEALTVPEKVTFNNNKEILNKFANSSGILENNIETVRAIQVAVAGRHNILLSGENEKSELIETLIPALTPNLTPEQEKINKIISDFSENNNPYEIKDFSNAPFIKTEPENSLEKILGGGPNCTPGDISFANSGTLFLDNAPEFRNTVLQMLRVPLESGKIALSRGEKKATYPTDFQLAMTSAPCPCGNNHIPGKICLCSENSKQEHWEKINKPLSEKIEIKHFTKKNENNSQTISIQDLRNQIENAYKIQRERKVFNHNLTSSQITEFCKLNDECQNYVNEICTNKSETEKKNLLKLTLTLANMDGREEIRLNDLQEANELCSPLFEKPELFTYKSQKKSADIEQEKETEKATALEQPDRQKVTPQPELFPEEEIKSQKHPSAISEYVPTPEETETAARILEKAGELPENIYNTIKWLVNVHRCYNDRIIPIVEKLYDTFDQSEAFERSKVLPLVFGKGKTEETKWCDEEKLSSVIGIYDKNLDYHTVWDRKYAAYKKMPEEKIKNLIEYDYAGDKHIFKNEEENSTDEKKYDINQNNEIMNVQDFTKFYSKSFNDSDYRIWRTTDWEGYVNASRLSHDDKKYLETSGSYVEETPGKWTHRVLFESGDIYKKIEKQKVLLQAAERESSPSALLHRKNIAILQSLGTSQIKIDDIHIAVNSTIAEEFQIPQKMENGEIQNLNLAESFILWAKGISLETDATYNRRSIDFGIANISKDELPENITWHDIVDFIDGVKVMADRTSSWSFNKTEDEIKNLRQERKKEADLKRMVRAETANKLFDRYLHEGLDDETKERFCKEYNRRFNSYVIPKYEKLPLYIDGMSRMKGNSEFKLYEQQLKGTSRLCIKGNGILAYDVGVGKTATGIVANANQIQCARSRRPLIIVPNSVYPKWVNDIRELFPKIKVNDLYNFNDEAIDRFRSKEDGHTLNIEPSSISVCTYEALKRITFTEESCKTTLFTDFAKLLSADFDGSAKENAETFQKIKDTIGISSAVEDSGYVFFEKCKFDNITVDEAHNFKNLWVVPRPKNKNDSNEYSGIPCGTPSKRALKLYAMTQIVQEKNANRNVYLLTATPFTNSPLEVYSMLSYVGRQRLINSGIYSLRDFLNQFAHTKLELAVSPKGNIEYKQVMKDWKELPALQNLLMEFIDKVDGEEAGIIRPKKFTHLKELDLSPLQKTIMAEEERRMTESKNDNPGAVLEAMNNMRLALVSPALLKQYKYQEAEIPLLSEFVESSPKLKFVCDAVADMYKKHKEKGQFIYMPLGKEGHTLVKDYLISHGIPKEAIQIINGEINGTPEKKDKITAAFNDLKNPLKIIIGGKNTSEGIDLNGNSFVMYNCSLGWNPSETTQAEGRIWRQGNLQGHVHIVYPVMNDSIDSLLYQKHDEKRSRINDLWTYKGNTLNVEDINPEELKFDLIKNPEKRVMLIFDEQTKDLNNQLSRIELKIENFNEIITKKIKLEKNIQEMEEEIESYRKDIDEYISAGETVPNWIKESHKDYKKHLESLKKQEETVNAKLEKLNIHNEEKKAMYIHNLNMEKQSIQQEIESQKEKIPEKIKEMKIHLAEQKLTEHPIEKQREALENEILSNLRPMSEILEEMKRKKNTMIENDSSLKEKNYGLLFDETDYQKTEKLSVSEQTPVYYTVTDDTFVTDKEIRDAEKRRQEISEPILTGKKEGLWTAFKTFEEKGVFDIVGQTLPLSESNTMDNMALEQLKSAMEIYRDKKFETFRYVLIDRKTGEISDQLSVSTNMPSICKIDYDNCSLLKSVISRAEEKDCFIVAAHNHPSGNTQPSIEDIHVTEKLRMSCKRTDGINRFAGHIILDHDSFSVYTPENGWNNIQTEQTNDNLLKENIPEWMNTTINDHGGLNKVAENLNDTNSWNDKHIPVVFANADLKINAIKYYDKKFFYAPPENVKNEFFFTAISTGSIGTFPIITEHFTEKLSEKEQAKIEKTMKLLMEKGCIIDCGLPTQTLSSKLAVKPGSFYTNDFRNLENPLRINTTWKTEINPALFPQTEPIKQSKHKIAEIER